MARPQLFLERRGYRMRRMMDLLRLLPVIGLALWLVPLMWAQPEDAADPTGTGAALVFIFGVWFALSLAAFLLWLKTRKSAARLLSGSDEPESG